MCDWDNTDINDVEIGIVGGGSMGSGMTLLFAEHGSSVGAYDKDDSAVKKTLEEAKSTKSVDQSKVHGYSSLKNLVSVFDESKPRVLVFSLPHGDVVNSVLEELGPMLKKGDVIVDGGNEWWKNTEARQEKCKQWGVHFIGTGVSGGYQAARFGPSISPSGDPEAWKIVKPLLEKWAAKDKEGNPCVGLIGPGGSGHYVKMVHNGIEQAHLSLLAELRSLLHFQLSLSNADVADIYDDWNNKGELSGNYLIMIGAKALRFKKGDGFEGKTEMKDGIVEGIEDKVTQDVDNSEGTGVWTCEEIAARHCAAPAIAAAHQLRIISANRGERLDVVEKMKVPQPKNGVADGKDKELIETFRIATYGAILGAFVQGFGIIARASKDEGWNVSLAECMRIWRAGCIIQSDGISDFLDPLLNKPDFDGHNLLQVPEIAAEIGKTYASLKKLVAMSVEADAVIPAFSATLEWMKSVGGKDLPTSFEEMELDYFGHHNYDLKRDPQEGTKKGSHHTEFAPA